MPWLVSVWQKSKHLMAKEELALSTAVILVYLWISNCLEGPNDHALLKLFQDPTAYVFFSVGIILFLLQEKMGYLFSIEVFIRSFCNRSCLCLYERSSASFLDASPYKREKIIMNNLGGGGGFSKVHFQIQTVLTWSLTFSCSNTSKRRWRALFRMSNSFVQKYIVSWRNLEK